MNIRVIKENSDYRGIVIHGHASSEFGERGKNILCAAISTISQTLLGFLLEKGFVKSWKLEEREGYLEFHTHETTSQSLINICFELVLSGIENLKEQYPEELNIVY